MELPAPGALRIGILGAANIARQFTSGVAPSKLVAVTAVASRDLAKAQSFAKECGIERALGSYEALLADPQIDAIYIPLPNTLHAKWAIRAAEAGKHVLCEKPLATSAADARAMFEAARRHNVHLVEAYPYLAQPLSLKLRELVSAGAIGKIQLIRSSFGVPFSDATNIRLKADGGGGALLDAGSYVISLIRIVAGERPQRVHAVARMGETGVDKTVVATLEFDSGLLAQMACSFSTSYHRHAMISGETGVIETNYLNHPPLGGPPALTIRRGATVATTLETVEAPGGNGFLFEAESFQKLVTRGPAHWTGSTPEESIDIALTLDAIAQSVRSNSAAMVAS